MFVGVFLNSIAIAYDEIKKRPHYHYPHAVENFKALTFYPGEDPYYLITLIDRSLFKINKYSESDLLNFTNSRGFIYLEEPRVTRSLIYENQGGEPFPVQTKHTGALDASQLREGLPLANSEHDLRVFKTSDQCPLSENSYDKKAIVKINESNEAGMNITKMDLEWNAVSDFSPAILIMALDQLLMSLSY